MLVAFACSTQVLAQDYPSKLVAIKVAFPAGGSADAGIRQLQQRLQGALGQTVIVENVPGAGGTLGANAVLNAPADGYTVLGTTGTDLNLAPMSLVSAKYDPQKFRLIAPVVITDFVLVSSNAHSFKNVEELIKHAKNAGNKELSIAHWGHGSTAHVVGADFETTAGITLLNVPYKGVAPIIPDLIGAQVDLSFLPLAGPTLGLIQTGKVRPIGVTGARRNPHLPDVPTLSEYRGLKGFEHSIWSGLFVRRETPEAVAAKLTASVNASITAPEFKKYLEDSAGRPVAALSPQEADAFFKSEAAKLASIAKRIKLKPE